MIGAGLWLGIAIKWLIRCWNELVAMFLIENVGSSKRGLSWRAGISDSIIYDCQKGIDLEDIFRECGNFSITDYAIFFAKLKEDAIIEVNESD